MNTPIKVLLGLVILALVSVGIYYVLFKVPASPGPLEPAGDQGTPAGSQTGTPGGGTGAGGGSGASQGGGAYSQLLAEGDAENSFYTPEDADMSYLNYESKEISDVAKVYYEVALPANSNFCNALPAVKSQFLAAIDARGKAVESARAKASNEMESKRKTRDDLRTNEHSKNNGTKDAYFIRIGALSKNASLKYKVDVYTKAVSDAINARRDSMRSAITLFREGMSQVTLAKKNLIDDAVTEYRGSAVASFDLAQSSCNSGSLVSNIRTRLESDLKLAHDAFVNDQVAAEKMSTSILPLISQKKTSFALAISKFKSAMTTARTQFKSSFPQGE